jgi:hypothetical protein
LPPRPERPELLLLEERDEPLERELEPDDRAAPEDCEPDDPDERETPEDRVGTERVGTALRVGADRVAGADRLVGTLRVRDVGEVALLDVPIRLVGVVALLEEDGELSRLPRIRDMMLEDRVVGRAVVPMTLRVERVVRPDRVVP